MKTWDEQTATPIPSEVFAAARQAMDRHNRRSNDPAEQRKFAARFRFLNAASHTIPPRFEMDGKEIGESEFLGTCWREGFNAQTIVNMMEQSQPPRALSPERLTEIHDAIRALMGNDSSLTVTTNGIVNIVRGRHSWILALASLEDDAAYVATSVKNYVNNFPNKCDQWCEKEPRVGMFSIAQGTRLVPMGELVSGPRSA